MPVITFESAKLTKEQKQVLAKEFTETAAKVTGLPKEGFFINPEVRTYIDEQFERKFRR